jgi:hypothetical protein
MSVPPENSRSDRLLEKGFAILLGIFALAVVLMLAVVLYSCLTPQLGKKGMNEVPQCEAAARVARRQLL